MMEMLQNSTAKESGKFRVPSLVVQTDTTDICDLTSAKNVRLSKRLHSFLLICRIYYSNQLYSSTL